MIANNRVGSAPRDERRGRHALFPIAVLADCAVYPAATPSPVDLIPAAEDGGPALGGFRPRAATGMVKLEGVQPLMWAAELLDVGHNSFRPHQGRHRHGGVRPRESCSTARLGEI